MWAVLISPAFSRGRVCTTRARETRRVHRHAVLPGGITAIAFSTIMSIALPIAPKRQSGTNIRPMADQHAGRPSSWRRLCRVMAGCRQAVDMPTVVRWIRVAACSGMVASARSSAAAISKNGVAIGKSELLPAEYRDRADRDPTRGAVHPLLSPNGPGVGQCRLAKATTFASLADPFGRAPVLLAHLRSRRYPQ